MMGSADDDPYARDDEKPLKSVMVGGFYMLDHPVTNAEFKAFLNATGREDEREVPSGFDGNDQPTINVTQEESEAYSKWLSEEVSRLAGIYVIGRLPFEEEWEKGAKGPSGDEYIKTATQKQAHFIAETTRSVKHRKALPNGYGLTDMIGNVWERTRSPYKEGSPFYVARGGSWRADRSHNLRAAYRDFIRPNVRNDRLGFRPVVVPQGSPK